MAVFTVSSAGLQTPGQINHSGKVENKPFPGIVMASGCHRTHQYQVSHKVQNLQVEEVNQAGLEGKSS